MEVYKITNTRTGQVYVGSTIYTAEKRLNNRSSGHLYQIRSGSNQKFHREVRESNDTDNLLLEVIETLPDNTESRELRAREDYWIKFYFNKLGKDMMYNEIDSAIPHTGVPSQETINKSLRTREEKYGSSTAMMNTPEALAKMYQTNIEKYGHICGQLYTPKAIDNKRKSFSTKILYKSTIYYGIPKLHEALINDGYDLTEPQVRHFVQRGCLSKKNQELYPNLINEVQVVESSKRPSKS